MITATNKLLQNILIIVSNEIDRIIVNYFFLCIDTPNNNSGI